MEKIKIDIYFDGACHNKKGSTKEPFGVGVAVFIDGEYSHIYSKSIYGAEGTSNIAEWCGCVHACRIAYFLHQVATGSITTISDKEPQIVYNPEITIFSDSELISKQFNGEYEVKREEFKWYYEESKKVVDKFDQSLKIKWVPRDLNWVADVLSKRGLHKDTTTKGADTPHIKSPRYKGNRFVGLENTNNKIS